MPHLLILQPANVATPLDAAFGFVVHASVAPDVPVPLVIASVTELESVVTVFPPASCTVTCGCVVKAVKATAPAGCWVKASFAAGPTVIAIAPLAVEVSEPSVAVSV